MKKQYITASVVFTLIFLHICASSQNILADELSGGTHATQPKTAETFPDCGILFAIWDDFALALADFTEAIRFDLNDASTYNSCGGI